MPGLSIECDRFFAKAVRKTLPDDSSIGVIDVDIGLTAGWGVSLPGSPTPRRVRRWRQYVNAPFGHVKSMPDLILVDGRFRRACALRWAIAVRELARPDTTGPVRLLFDDYFMEGRSAYNSVELRMGKPQRIGRAAHFVISPDNEVSRDDVEQALQDYR